MKDIFETTLALPVETVKLVALTPEDFVCQSENRNMPIDWFPSAKWLKVWSSRNIIGPYHLAPCSRRDIAIHVALMMESNKNLPIRMILTQEQRSDWVMIDNGGKKGKLILFIIKLIFLMAVPHSLKCEKLKFSKPLIFGSGVFFCQNKTPSCS